MPERNCEGEAGARTCTEKGGKKERMLEGEGGEQERKCSGESAEGGRSWEETKRTAQKAVERSLLREHNYRLYMICGICSCAF